MQGTAYAAWVGRFSDEAQSTKRSVLPGNASLAICTNLSSLAVLSLSVGRPCCHNSADGKRKLECMLFKHSVNSSPAFCPWKLPLITDARPHTRFLLWGKRKSRESSTVWAKWYPMLLRCFETTWRAQSNHWYIDIYIYIDVHPVSSAKKGQTTKETVNDHHKLSSYMLQCLKY